MNWRIDGHYIHPDHHRYGGYVIHLDELRTPEQVEQWVEHLRGKIWVDEATIKNFRAVLRTERGEHPAIWLEDQLTAKGATNMKNYCTFGYGHSHERDGRIFDKDCIAEVDGIDKADCRRKMFAAFGNKWGFQNDTLDRMDMRFYPRGVMALDADAGEIQQA